MQQRFCGENASQMRTLNTHRHSSEENMARSQRSPTQIIMDNLIFKTDHRKTRNPSTKSELTPTFNYTATLADSMWLRRRARRKP
ncbi:NinE family protein [Serratia marcescens]|uniref:NinE family protein n=2 Tax=Serratia marcescens TaxID=615 RepID=UPI0027E54C77|nr:NinE family protein [Serratia marcescens]